MKTLYDFIDVNGINTPLISKDFETVGKHKKELEETLIMKEISCMIILVLKHFKVI